jgi:hypothetical protein
MAISVPYLSSGQELGETRTAMTKRLMKDMESIIEKYKDKREKYYVLFHAKPWPNKPNVIRIKPIAMAFKPRMMLSCLLFSVDNQEGKLMLEWALPGDWPTWSVGGKNEPVPETIASIKASGIKYHYENFLPG